MSGKDEIKAGYLSVFCLTGYELHENNIKIKVAARVIKMEFLVLFLVWLNLTTVKY